MFSIAHSLHDLGSLCGIDFKERLWNPSVIISGFLLFFVFFWIEIPLIAKPRVAFCGMSETFNLIFPRRRGLAMSQRVAAQKWISHFPKITESLWQGQSVKMPLTPANSCWAAAGQRSASEYRPSLAAQELVLWPRKMQGRRNFFFFPPFQGARGGSHPCRRQPTPDLICPLRLPSCWGNPTRVRRPRAGRIKRPGICCLAALKGNEW